MKRQLRILFIGMALVAGRATAAENPAYDLAAILSGTFDGSTPGNKLRLTLRNVTTDPSHPFDLFLQVTGTYQGGTVRQQGVIRLESMGRDVTVSYIPHFDPTVTALSGDATRFSEREASAACGINMKPRGDGFVGETLGSSCAIAIRGAVSKWTIETEPGSIRLRDAKTGETLRFQRVAKG